jgi:hypothetical protein
VLISAAVFLAIAAGAVAPQAGMDVYESSDALTPEGQLDKIVFNKLASLKVHPTLCSDAVFVRRAYLDIIGTLPTAQEAREFIQDTDTRNKRRALIDRLLERDEYADYWAMRWGDILRIKAEFPVNLWPNAAQAFHRWVRESIAANKPYDRFVNEMLTSSGSNFRVGPVNFYRAIQNRTPDGIASAVALTFMGTRTDAWPTNKLEGMSVFFSQISYKPTSEWKEEHVFWNPLGSNVVIASSVPGKPAIAAIAQPTNTVAQAFDPTAANLDFMLGVFPDGTKVKLSPNKDPREVFADWLVTPKNRWFTRAIANRLWGWIMGRGIVHEPDDIRDDNPPSNPALLAYLEKEMIAGRYDMKRFMRLVFNSKTYQLSSMPKITTPEAEANFASYALRRLDAEVLIDVINKVTGATDLYTSPIPEPFTYIPENKPAVAIADGSITSPFLTLFGRTARATGMENERNNKPVPSQWLHLLNSSHIYRKISDGPKMRAIIDSGRKPQEVVEELYLTILSRLPTADEVKSLEEYGTTQSVRQPPVMKNGKSVKQPDKTIIVKRRDDWVDIAWALINSAEFLYRH